MPSRKNADAAGAFYRDRTVLITGGLGFIGSNLAARLAGCGARVTILDALVSNSGGSLDNVAGICDQVRISFTDLRDPGALGAVVSGQEFIFHLAGKVCHGDSMRDPQLDLEVNCVATLNLLECCRKHNPAARLLYTSTRQVYGRPQALPVNENHPTRPIDVNGINKLAAEYYHLLYDSAYGIHSTVLRLTNTYGPGQRVDSDRQGVAAVFIRRALMGQTLTLYGDGRQLRDFNYVDDVVEALLLALAEPACHGSVYNLGAARPHSLLEFVAALRSACQFESVCVPFPADNKLIDIGDYYGDYSRFHSTTGWEPAVSLEEGLARTIAHHRTGAARSTAADHIAR